ncbi:hypothetical protein QR680_012920 [Steinernema hermaphroditum]|uniref:L antigen family member 3 n=1 Tax=Steinernema hermaphroditum TaxID=289476 RepID=A0AA39I3R5_9BILA|nr:hypothetical protein QR680_012920 [Steinernema hermaphroditum]
MTAIVKGAQPRIVDGCLASSVGGIRRTTRDVTHLCRMATADCASTPVQSPSQHSVCIRLDFESEEKAAMICRTLAVDKEPKRSCAVRNMRTEGSFLIVDITCADAKFLQKSIQNMFDMADLAKQTFDKVGSYEYKSAENVASAPQKKKGRSS